MLALVLGFPSVKIRAQTSLPDEAASRAEASEQKERERKALLVLEDVISEGQTLKLPENRIRVEMLVAVLLWTRDEERARTLFKEAQDTLVTFINASADYSNPQAAGNLETFSQLRHELLNLLAKRDPQAALNFLRATRRPTAPAVPARTGRGVDEETALELNLAGQIAAQDPKQALRLAEESLSKGLGSALVNVLLQLRTKDAEAARKLTSSIVQKLRGMDFSNDYEAMNLLTSLVNLTRPASASVSGGNSSSPTNAATAATTTTTMSSGQRPNEAAPVVGTDEQTRRELLDTAVSAIINTQTNRLHPLQGLAKALQDQMPEVEKSVPTRIAPLRRKLAEFEKIVDPRVRAWRDQQAVIESGSIDSLLEAAAKSPPDMREQLYSQAAWKAMGQGDTERARLLAEKITHPQQRAQLLREIERQTGWRALEQRNLEEAQRALVRASTPEERVPLLIGLAGIAATKEETKKQARAFLDEAISLIGVRAENQVLFSLKLQVAETYAQLDAARSFELVEEGVEHLNELVAAAAVLNGFGFDAFKDGEMTPRNGYPWSALAEQSVNVLATLARTDFDRAAAIAQRFARPDVRVMIRLGFAQRLLDENSEERSTLPLRNAGMLPPPPPMMRAIVIDR